MFRKFRRQRHLPLRQALMSIFLLWFHSQLHLVLLILQYSIFLRYLFLQQLYRFFSSYHLSFFLTQLSLKILILNSSLILLILNLQHFHFFLSKLLLQLHYRLRNQCIIIMTYPALSTMSRRYWTNSRSFFQRLVQIYWAVHDPRTLTSRMREDPPRLPLITLSC